MAAKMKRACDGKFVVLFTANAVGFQVFDALR